MLANCEQTWLIKQACMLYLLVNALLVHMCMHYRVCLVFDDRVVNDCVYKCRHYYITDYTIECKDECYIIILVSFRFGCICFLFVSKYEVNLVNTAINYCVNKNFSLVMKIWIKRNLNDEILL